MIITKEVREAIMESIISILDKPTRHHKEQYPEQDKYGNILYDNNGNEMLETPIYYYEWDKHNKTFDIGFYDDSICIIVDSHDIKKAIMSVDECSIAQLLLLSSDFLNDKIEIPYNTDENVSVLIVNKTGEDYEKF